MDLPPSGWYPDPYGVPGLLRWWDGSTWTQHTHADNGTQAPDGAEPATTVQPAAMQPAVQPTTVQPAVRPTTVQPSVQPSAVQRTTVQPAVQPSARPATVQPTAVQPAVQPTAHQPAVTSVQPTTVQPPTVQPTMVQPAGPWPAGGPPQGADASGTQVLFLGDDAWTTHGTPGGAEPGSRYGYYRAQRRRRVWLMGGLAGGTALALALIALVVNSLGQSPVAQTTTPPPATPVAVRTTPPTSPTPSPTPSATASGSRLTDGQSGLSYIQLASPWQPTCPSSLNNQDFTWTTGESAAEAINNGQSRYGVACSGPLPTNYGYNGVQDLQNTATNLVNKFNNNYYGQLSHNFQQEVSQPVSISGHPGWEIKFLMTYTNAQGQGLSWNDEQGAVVVTDLGTGVQPAVFYTSIPANLGENNVDSLVSSLLVSSVPTQAGSPTAGSPAAGSPTAGSPSPSDGNGGNGGNPN